MNDWDRSLKIRNYRGLSVDRLVELLHDRDEEIEELLVKSCYIYHVTDARGVTSHGHFETSEAAFSKADTCDGRVYRMKVEKVGSKYYWPRNALDIQL